MAHMLGEASQVSVGSSNPSAHKELLSPSLLGPPLHRVRCVVSQPFMWGLPWDWGNAKRGVLGTSLPDFLASEVLPHR